MSMVVKVVRLALVAFIVALGFTVAHGQDRKATADTESFIASVATNVTVTGKVYFEDPSYGKESAIVNDTIMWVGKSYILDLVTGSIMEKPAKVTVLEQGKVLLYIVHVAPQGVYFGCAPAFPNSIDQFGFLKDITESK